MTVPANRNWPQLGHGVGLRPPHFNYILRNKPAVDWFEIVSENFIDTFGRPLAILEKIRQDYPIVLHGVSLSIGSTDPINWTYLKKLKALATRIGAALISDHLCWTSVGGHYLHDLLPLPLTKESLKHVVERVDAVQSFLGQRLVLENPSTYVSFQDAEMTEWELLTEVAERSDCGILLDVNNLYVNAFNHGFDPKMYLRTIPEERVAYYHLAGHTDMGTYYFDTHDAKVIAPVWDLFERTIESIGPRSTLIEWDAKIPNFGVLESEADRARAVQQRVKDADRLQRAVA